MTEAEVFASCLALSHCHFLDTTYEGDPFSDELNSGASNVCHYCTIDTLLSIIENQCLRFTDVRFLNDSTEFLEIIPMIEHVLTNGNYSSSFKQFFLQSSIIEDLKSYRQSYSAISNVDQTYKDMAELMFVPVCGRMMIIILLSVYEVRSLWNFRKKTGRFSKKRSPSGRKIGWQNCAVNTSNC